MNELCAVLALHCSSSILLSPLLQKWTRVVRLLCVHVEIIGTIKCEFIIVCVYCNRTMLILFLFLCVLVYVSSEFMFVLITLFSHAVEFTLFHSKQDTSTHHLATIYSLFLYTPTSLSLSREHILSSCHARSEWSSPAYPSSSWVYSFSQKSFLIG